MKKRILSLLMVVFLLVGLCDISAFAWDDTEDDKYTLEIVEAPTEEVVVGSEYTVKVKIKNISDEELDLSGYYLYENGEYWDGKTQDLSGTLSPEEETTVSFTQKAWQYVGEIYEGDICMENKVSEWVEGGGGDYSIRVSKAIEVVFTPQLDFNNIKRGVSYPFSISIENLSYETFEEIRLDINIREKGTDHILDPVVAYGYLDDVDYSILDEDDEVWTYWNDFAPGRKVECTGKITVPLDAKINNNVQYILSASVEIMWKDAGKDEAGNGVFGEWFFETSKDVKISDSVEVVKASQSISASNIVKTVGDAPFALNAKLTNGNGKLSYLSSNTKVATIGQDGKVTLKGAGTTNITITASETAEYKKASKTIVLTVKPKVIKVSSVKISGSSKKIAAGKKIKLSASVSPSNATNKKVTWKSSNTKVAKVDKNGKVTMQKKSGGKTVTITATAQDGSGKKATYKIKSMKGVVKKISISGKKTVKAGKSVKLKAKVSASKGANKKLKWKSSNTKYAKVTSSGKVKTYKAGKGKKVKITATATDGSNKKKTITIKIK